MHQKKSTSGKLKEREAKQSKRKMEDEAADHESLSFPYFLSTIEEKSIPTDQNTDVMLSEAIMRIAEPYIKKYDKKDLHIKTLIGLAIAAWNLPLIPKKYYQAASKNIAEIIPTEFTLDQTESLLMIVFEMLRNRVKYYGDLKFFINRSDVLQTEKGWKVKILSTIEIQEQMNN